MERTSFWNIANIASTSRIVLLLITVLFMFLDNFSLRFTAIILCLIVMNSDYIDGYLARKYKVATKFGAVMDVMADRIIENVFWVSLALLAIVPIWAPILIVIRGFSTDAVRSVALKKGKTTFAMMKSKLGYALVASRISRGLINISKTATFTVGIIYLTYQVPWLLTLTFWLALWTVAFSLVRGALTIWDSRKYLS